MINQFRDYRKKKEEEMRQRKRAYKEGEIIAIMIQVMYFILFAKPLCSFLVTSLADAIDSTDNVL